MKNLDRLSIHRGMYMPKETIRPMTDMYITWLTEYEPCRWMVYRPGADDKWARDTLHGLPQITVLCCAHVTIMTFPFPCLHNARRENRKRDNQPETTWHTGSDVISSCQRSTDECKSPNGSIDNRVTASSTVYGSLWRTLHTSRRPYVKLYVMWLCILKGKDCLRIHVKHYFSHS